MNIPCVLRWLEKGTDTPADTPADTPEFMVIFYYIKRADSGLIQINGWNIVADIFISWKCIL